MTRLDTVPAGGSAAFDEHALDYDSVAGSALGKTLRARVHKVLYDLTAPGISVADLGCGSGIDAAWLAPQVGSVRGFDQSESMVALARQRCTRFDNVSITQADSASLDLEEPVDLVLANFGVINCIGDLDTFQGRLATMLKPRSQAVLVTMPHWCPIELGIGAIRRNLPLIKRRQNGTSHPGYPDLAVRYASANQLAAKFSPSFTMVHAESLGLVLPPFEQRHVLEERPQLRTRLATLDKRLGSFGAKVGLGDHHIVVLERVA